MDSWRSPQHADFADVHLLTGAHLRVIHAVVHIFHSNALPCACAGQGGTSRASHGRGQDQFARLGNAADSARE
ncbi:hypothetical protein [Acidovorax delafieldii]|uniref:hypothetical protein n=1 Tax=Acidovorax delafieldii TaxID=47920 RepID=UPI000A6BBCE4|nr:hypothetical protein [Acidovorax delafieldii]